MLFSFPNASDIIVITLYMRVILTMVEEEMIEKTKNNINKQIGKKFQNSKKHFIDISWIEREKLRIRKANRRFIQNPYDLRGLRHARYFAQFFQKYLNRIENPKISQRWAKRFYFGQTRTILV